MTEASKTSTYASIVVILKETELSAPEYIVASGVNDGEVLIRELNYTSKIVKKNIEKVGNWERQSSNLSWEWLTPKNGTNFKE